MCVALVIISYTGLSFVLLHLFSGFIQLIFVLFTRAPVQLCNFQKLLLVYDYISKIKGIIIVNSYMHGFALITCYAKNIPNINATQTAKTKLMRS